MEATAVSKQGADICDLGAAALARLLAAGSLSAREVVEAHLRCLEETTPRLNALVAERFAAARAEADAADAARRRGDPLGPLHGVPVTVKETFDVAGLPTTWGLRARAGRVAATDDPLVARLRAAGGIVLGKTNVPQLLMYNESDNPVYGRANNPWDPLHRSPGGSSGGEAAVVAVGGAALGLGTDIGGSVRTPAHCCGIHALKPTPGRLPLTAAPGIRHIPRHALALAAPGPLARHVADLALALRILDGTAGGGPPADPAGVRVAALRVAWYDDDGILAPSPAIRRAVREAAGALRAAGAVVEPWTPPDPAGAQRLYLALLCGDGGAGLRATLGTDAPDPRLARLLRAIALPKATRAVARLGLYVAGQRRAASIALPGLAHLTRAGLAATLAAWAAYRRDFLAALDARRFDAILGPPYPLPALTHGASARLSTEGGYANICNLVGLPAGVVAATRVRPGEESDRRAGRDDTERAAREVEAGSVGLPVGVQVAARPWREDVVLALLGALEAHFAEQASYPRSPTIIGHQEG